MKRTNPSTVTTDISNATTNRISANFFTLGFGFGKTSKTSKTSKAAPYLTNLSETCAFTVHLQAIASMIKLNKIINALQFSPLITDAYVTMHNKNSVHVSKSKVPLTR